VKDLPAKDLPAKDLPAKDLRQNSVHIAAWAGIFHFSAMAL
jgi:hypothetical protein